MSNMNLNAKTDVIMSYMKMKQAGEDHLWTSDHSDQSLD
jgi:hypothetical protein